MPPPPPPPPPGPPPPPTSGPPPQTKQQQQGRAALLTDISKGARLKSTKGLCNDRSAPQVNNYAALLRGLNVSTNRLDDGQQNGSALNHGHRVMNSGAAVCTTSLNSGVSSDSGSPGNITQNLNRTFNTNTFSTSASLDHVIEPNSIDYAQLNPHIKGIAIVKDQLFYITDAQSQVSVYDTFTGKAKPYLTIPGLSFPQGIAGCSHNSALYISDFKFSRIHRVNLANSIFDHLDMVDQYYPRGLSVTSEHNILVAVYVKGRNANDRIVEYTSSGQLIRDIEFIRGSKDSWQVVEMCAGRFIICHGRWQSSLHRLCLIHSSSGNIIKTYGKKPRCEERNLDEPHSIVVDSKTGRVFMAESGKNRILMFSRDLSLIGQIQSRDLASPMCMCVTGSGQLYVTEWHTGRMLVISVPD